jgi:hypothetical protein
MKALTGFIFQAPCFLICAIFPLKFVRSEQAKSAEINTILMNSTFQISGPSKVEGKTTFGTVFFMLEPEKDDPQR